MVIVLVITAHYQSMMQVTNNQTNQTNQYNRWVISNADDLQNLFDLYCDNTEGYLNIAGDTFQKKAFFDDFSKFIYTQTSSDLKIYGQKNRYGNKTEFM